MGEIREKIDEEIKVRRFVRDFPLNFQRTFFFFFFFFFFLALQRGVCWDHYSIFRNSLSSTFRCQLLIFNAFRSIQSYEDTPVLVNLGLISLSSYKVLLFLRTHHPPFCLVAWHISFIPS
jgi:hypothetical protein